MLHIKEEYTENPNDNVEDLMDDFAKYLDKQDIAVDYVDYSSKTIYVKTIEDLKEARYELRTEFEKLRQLGVHIQSSIGTDGLDKDYIKDTKTQTEKLSIKEDFEPYTYVKSKTVYDSDGWTTEYTMYYDEVNDRYVFVLGDSDFYNPNDGYEEFDWECNTEREANDWFDNYNGFEDDLDESLIQELRKTRNQVMDELEADGYDIVDTGYGDYNSELTKWKNKGYDVKGFYVKTDTPGLRMWVLYGKLLSEAVIREDKYDLSWKEVGNEIIYMDDDRLKLPIYEKRVYNHIVIQVVPEESNDELIWTVYYTPNIGKDGFKLAETGFFSSGEAMDYVDDELIGKFDIFNMQKESITEETGKSYWKYNQYEDTLPEGDYYDKYTIYRFRLIPCETPEDCYEGDIRRFSAWAVTELDYPYKEVYCTKDEAYGYLMDYLNHSRYETIHDL